MDLGRIEVTADDIEASKLVGASGTEVLTAAIHTALDRQGCPREGRYVEVTREEITIDVPSDWSPTLAPAEDGLGLLRSEVTAEDAGGQWVVVDSEGQRHEHDGWCTAAHQYRGLVREWADTQDAFVQTLTGKWDEWGMSWRASLDAEGFEDSLVEGKPHRMGMAANDGYGGEALFRLEPAVLR